MKTSRMAIVAPLVFLAGIRTAHADINPPPEESEEEGCSCAAPGLDKPLAIGSSMGTGLLILALGRRRQKRVSDSARP